MSIEPLFHKNLPARERILLEGYNVEIYGVLFSSTKRSAVLRGSYGYNIFLNLKCVLEENTNSTWQCHIKQKMRLI